MALSSESRRLLSLRDRIVREFGASDWVEVGVLTDSSPIIEGHDRLLRSLRFGDDDYSSNVLSVLRRMAALDEGKLKVIEDYLDETGGDAIEASVGDPADRSPGTVVRPTVFRIPKETPDPSLMAVMMPFSPAFNGVYEAIERSAQANSLRPLRADNIWEHSTIIQDIFTLIFRATYVVCDFTDKNPNVFYEAGIAHTLGKHVIPIAQHKSDLPFDLQHHRAIIYSNNGEGLTALGDKLRERLAFLAQSQA